MSDVDINKQPQSEAPDVADEGKDTTPEPGTTPEEESTAFYKSELEKTQKELEQAKYTLNQNRLKEKEESKKETPNEEQPKGMTQEELDAYLDQKLAEKESKKFRENLSKIVKDDNTRAKVEYYLDNVVRSTGNPEADLQVALTLAGAERTNSENGELKRALKTKPKGVDLPGTAPSGEESKQLSEADKAFLEGIGVSESDIEL